MDVPCKRGRGEEGESWGGEDVERLEVGVEGVEGSREG